MLMHHCIDILRFVKKLLQLDLGALYTVKEVWLLMGVKRLLKSKLLKSFCQKYHLDYQSSVRNT